MQMDLPTEGKKKDWMLLYSKLLGISLGILMFFSVSCSPQIQVNEVTNFLIRWILFYLLLTHLPSGLQLTGFNHYRASFLFILGVLACSGYVYYIAFRR